MKKIFLIMIAVLTSITVSFAENEKLRKEVATKYYEILDSGKADELSTILSENLIDHDAISSEHSAFEEIKGLVLALNAGFDKLRHEVEQVHLIDNDKVFIRWRMTGRHTGTFFGAPASNKKVNFVGHDLLKLKDGKVIEIWHVEELMKMMGQVSQD
jgi:steroid delta-isomerase-like uncharacterized protein